jgi:uncharacterized protein
MNFTLSLTHDCQFRCTYCYAGDKIKKIMPKETIDKSIEFLFTHEFEKLEFGFFGGEPLLEWEKIIYATKKIEEIASQKNIKTNRTITTNGTLLTEENVKWLKENLFYMVISLDGNELMHNTHRKYANGAGTFKDVINGLKNLQKYYKNKEYSINLVVTPQNVKYLSDSVKYLYLEHNIEDIAIADDLYSDWDDYAQIWENEYKKIGDFYIEMFRKDKFIKISFIEDKIATGIKGGYDACKTCSFGENEVIVAPSGNLYPCERLIGNDNDQEMIIGNVFNGYDIKKKFNLLKLRGNTNEECKTCELKPRCMNFCGCTNYTVTKSINTAFGTLCFNQKLSIEVADYVSETLYNEKNPLFMKEFYEDSSYYDAH